MDGEGRRSSALPATAAGHGTGRRQPSTQPGSSGAPGVCSPFQRSFLGTSECFGSGFSLGSQQRLPVPFNTGSFLPVRRLLPV